MGKASTDEHELIELIKDELDNSELTPEDILALEGNAKARGAKHFGGDSALVLAYALGRFLQDEKKCKGAVYLNTVGKK